jgi:hypothetical protein
MRAAALAILLSCIGAPCIGAGGAVAKPLQSVFDHKDWIGVCDNTGRCTVMGLAADGSESRGYIALQRDGGGAAQPRLTIAVYADEAAPIGPLHLRAPGFDLSAPASVDDQEVKAEVKDTAAIQAFVRLAASEAKGVQIAIGKMNVTVSLSGAAAALTWMDDRQGRIGGVTALSKKGPKPATAVPPALPEPVYAAAPKGSASEIKPVVFPKAVLARGELKDCEKEQLAAADERGAWRLGPDLILWSVPCTLGAYNLQSVFFLSDGKGGAIRPAPVPLIPTPESADPGADPPYAMINADFDPKTMMLNAFEKGRGLGDCGVLRNYLWDGKSFQPLEIDYMPECRGVEADAWPALHRGRAR